MPLRNAVKLNAKKMVYKNAAAINQSVEQQRTEVTPERTTIHRRRRADLESFLTQSSDERDQQKPLLAFGSNCKRPPLFEIPDHPGELLYDIESGLRLTRA